LSQARIIAIDGLVAADKSSVGRALARRLGYCFIDIGIMNRALKQVVETIYNLAVAN
jgi:cytidylate kinase